MTITEANIRSVILKNKGLRLEVINNQKHITNKALLHKDNSNCKTNLMLYVEAHHNHSIEELVWNGSLVKVSNRLELPIKTIQRWRIKFPKN